MITFFNSDPMVRNIMEIGLKIKCMEKVFYNGQTVEGMRENMKKIKNTDMVYLHGQMAENMMDKYYYYFYKI